MRYWPEPSVTAVRTLSMSAGLAASTVTPGRTAPEASLATPEIDAPLCAAAVQAVSSTHAAAASTLLHPRIDILLDEGPLHRRGEFVSILRRHNVRPHSLRVQYIFGPACIQNWYRPPAIW